MVGLPVLTASGGERLGEVADLLVNGHGGRVIGLLLSGGNAVFGHRVYPIEEIQAIGDGAVLVRDGGAVLTARQNARVRRLLARHTDLVGKRLLNQKGDDLGVIDDLLFHPETGIIAGYQVSGGLVKDLVEGKGFIPVAAGLSPGPDAVICQATGVTPAQEVDVP